MIENVLEIEKSELQTKVQKMFDDNYRFITVTCVDLGDQFDLLYHFGKEYEMEHLRLKLKKDEELESVSNIYFCALLVENEIKDLFGVKINNILIDYQGKFLLSEGAPDAPMCNTRQIEIEVRGGKENGE